MLLGFISLLLLIIEDNLAQICLRNTMPWQGGVKCASAPAPAPPSAPGPAPLPAPAPDSTTGPAYGAAPSSVAAPAPSRRLLSISSMLPYVHPSLRMPSRHLLASAETPHCEAKGVEEGHGPYHYTAFLDERGLPSLELKGALQRKCISNTAHATCKHQQ